MFSCNLSPALLAECSGFCLCYCGNTGVERTLKQELAQKVDIEEETEIRVSTES